MRDTSFQEMFTALEMTNVSKIHALLGVPVLQEQYFYNWNVTLLPLPSGTVAYDNDLDITLWVSQTVNKTTNVRINSV